MNDAADHIESHPKDFQYTSVEFPHPCGTPGCALGWIAYFYTAGMGQPRNRGAISWIAEELDVCQLHFYTILARYQPRWTQDAQACANALRQYADTYLMEPSHANA